MSKVGNGCYQPIKGTIALDDDTIQALADAINDGAEGIELSISQIGCIKNSDGETTGAVYLSVEKNEDGTNGPTVVKAVSFADGSITDPYTGPISTCDPIVPPAPPVPMALETVCMRVDDVAQPVTPIITVDMDTGTVLATTYVDDYGQAITGVVTPPDDPCECGCPECEPETEIVANACMRAFDYFAESDWIAGETKSADILLDGNIVSTVVMDYLASSDGINKSSWYSDLRTAVNNTVTGWLMDVAQDTAVNSGERVIWRLQYTGPAPSTLEIVIGTDTWQMIANPDGTMNISGFEGNGLPFGTPAAVDCP